MGQLGGEGRVQRSASEWLALTAARGAEEAAGGGERCTVSSLLAGRMHSTAPPSVHDQRRGSTLRGGALRGDAGMAVASIDQCAAMRAPAEGLRWWRQLQEGAGSAAVPPRTFCVESCTSLTPLLLVAEGRFVEDGLSCRVLLGLSWMVAQGRLGRPVHLVHASLRAACTEEALASLLREWACTLAVYNAVALGAPDGRPLFAADHFVITTPS